MSRQINSVGLEFDPNIEILEFSEMKGTTETVEEEKELEPIELNFFEFFSLKTYLTSRVKHAGGSVRMNRVRLPRWEV